MHQLDGSPCAHIGDHVLSSLVTTCEHQPQASRVVDESVEFLEAPRARIAPGPDPWPRLVAGVIAESWAGTCVDVNIILAPGMAVDVIDDGTNVLRPRVSMIPRGVSQATRGHEANEKETNHYGELPGRDRCAGSRGET